MTPMDSMFYHDLPMSGELEWRTAETCNQMAVYANYINDNHSLFEVKSSTTAEEFAKTMASVR